MENKPQVSVIIVCMNRPDNLYPCLDSIRDHTGVPCETIVVAYRFSADNLAAARTAYPWVRFIESDEIRGFSENNNLALREAAGEFCFVLNDDTEFDGPVIDRLAADLQSLPDAAIVTPRLVNPDGSLQLCGRPEYPPFRYALQQWHLYREPVDDTVGKTPVTGDVFRTSNISGAAFLIRRSLFEEWGFFDERYFFTPEDIALSVLARSKGYGVYVDRGVAVTHKWRTTASRISTAVRPASIRGSLIFFAGGSALRYFLLGLSVWTAETAKLVKASFGRDRVKIDTYRHNAAAVFTRKTPKELFMKYHDA